MARFSKQFWIKNREGALVGGLVGLASAVAYKLSGGSFSFAAADVQSRAANISTGVLSQLDIVAIAYVTTIIAWIIVGATIGFLIDLQFGFKFSKQNRKWLGITAIALIVLIVSGTVPLAPASITTEDSESRAVVGAVSKIATAISTAIGKLGPAWISFIIITITGQITGFFKKLFTPEPTGPPIWIFFIIGFGLLLFLKKRGGQAEQPLIIRQ